MPEERTQFRHMDPLYIITPTLQCPASCRYCFMPHESPQMTAETLGDALDYVSASSIASGPRRTDILFHGGEPLFSGYTFWCEAFEQINRRFGGLSRRISMQSNLWLLDDEMAELFAENRVYLGTSLDGPKPICDAQRGEGYFDRTMQGVRLSRSLGIATGCIATLTAENLHRWPEVFDFFVSEDISFVVHPVVPRYGCEAGPYAVSPTQYADALVHMLDAYLKICNRIQILSLDQLCQSAFYGLGQVCTFNDCLDCFPSIGPDGSIYPCHKLCGIDEFRLGNVKKAPVGQALMDAPSGLRLRNRIERAYSACQKRDCEHFDYCYSGCYYNMLTAGERASRDPYCIAYRTAFDHIGKRLRDEIDCEDNLSAIARSIPERDEHPLFRSGSMINLAKARPHPLQITRTCQNIVAAVELARVDDLEDASRNLLQLGVAKTYEHGGVLINRLKTHLYARKPGQISDAFFHITWRCPSNCDHCYAGAGEDRAGGEEMPYERIVEFLQQADELRIGMATITGGEPLVHSRFDDLLAGIMQLRRDRQLGIYLFLSTSLPDELSQDRLSLLSEAFDQIGVSLDGPEEIHDRRRGAGSYRRVLTNLEKLSASDSNVLLGCTPWPGDQATEQESIEHVRSVATRLGLAPPKILPMLPIGRASSHDLLPISKNLPVHDSAEQLIESGFRPKRGCLGGHLHIDPNGDCYPCYACRWSEACLGNAEEGLHRIISSDRFEDLFEHTVDSNSKCRRCGFRYLCGGACLAWQENRADSTYAALPPDCAAIEKKAEELYHLALEKLSDVSEDLHASCTMQPVKGEKIAP